MCAAVRLNDLLNLAVSVMKSIWCDWIKHPVVSMPISSISSRHFINIRMWVVTLALAMFVSRGA
jgi:hypothetical protein